MEEKFDLVPLLEFISPSALDYNDWISVGMALKHEGYGIDIWDSWSQPDSRYNAREMESKWDSLGRNSAAPVTGAFITMKAKENGWQPHSYSGDGMATFGWDDEISYERDYKIVDNSWVEGKEIREPDDNWNPVEQLKTYIETLFKNDDYIGYVVNSWQRDDGKYSVSGSGVYGKTAEEILNDLNKYKDAKDLGWVVGD
ncbi:PriCT-2 domain-containing protein [Lactococcus cremoris]|uniref:Phage replicative DNA helicase, repA n=2 Tax=Lactococcus TaxID=1357 RepID=A0ABR5EDZ6_LACLC|nr:PriCT-2 domain-containing protein [Lactococcus cremoris]KKW70307.1 Phage replicative DNA helicase, repA [Lactococcus cremoris]